MFQIALDEYCRAVQIARFAKGWQMRYKSIAVCRIPIVVIGVTALCFCSSCSSVRVSDPRSTATEHFLMSQAVTDAVTVLSFDVLRGRRAYIDNSYLQEPERAFITAEFRAAALDSGALIKESRPEAEVIVEVRSGGVGIDRYESLVGIPSIYAPPTGSGSTGGLSQTVLTPELAITKSLKQYGFADISYVAYWADSGEIIAAGGPSVGRTYRQDTWFFGFGPRTIGNVPVVNYGH